MKQLRKFKEFIRLGVMVFLVTLTLAGCSIPDTLKDGLKEAFNSRAEANKSIANELYGAGLIREDTYNKLIKDIDSKLGGLADNLGDNNEDMQNLLKACVGFRLAVEPDHQVIDPITKKEYWVHGGDEQCGGARSPVENICVDGNSNHKKQCSDFYNGFISNFLVANEEKNILQNNVPCIRGIGSPIKPIEVISESLVEEINEQLSIPVYVLKTNITSKNGVGLDQVVEAVKNASNEKDTIKAEQLLSQYFEQATYIDKKDENKKKVLTVVDPADPEQQIIRITTQTYDESKNANFNPLKFNGKSISDEYTFYNDYDNFPSDSYGNSPGIDMTVSMGGEKVLAVRLIEFNQHAIQNLKDRTGLGQNRYMVINGRAYLMEYPIGYISGFEESEDRTEYKSIIERSQLGFNLLTCDFSKFDMDEDSISNQSHIISKEDPYITFNGALSLQDESQASLILYGETGITKDDEEIDECNKPWDLQLGGPNDNPYIVSTGRIVLRDYLEATYAPGVVSGEQFVVLGRKLRVLQLNGSKSSILAEMYDKEGNVIENAGQPVRLYINDFADLPALKSSNPKVKYISATQESTGNGAAGSTDMKGTENTPPTQSEEDEVDTNQDTGQDTNSEGSENTPTTQSEEDETDTSQDINSEGSENTPTTHSQEDGTDTDQDTSQNTNSEDSSASAALNSSTTKIDELGTEIVSKVSVSTLFPGSDIGIIDKNFTDDKPLFYAMLVRKNIFDTGLFSGWINNTDAGKNSLTWWNQWLQDHGFQYKINSDTLTEYLSGNYAFELTKEGVIILDLRTISKIQEEFDQDTKTETGTWIRTLFVIFGYLIIVYALILLIAWNLDINVDMGFNILLFILMTGNIHLITGIALNIVSGIMNVLGGLA